MNPIIQLKNSQKELAKKIRADHDKWDSYVFRHNHIAYCELRGRKREQIEIPAEDNKPDEVWIERIKKEWNEKISEWRTE